MAKRKRQGPPCPAIDTHELLYGAPTLDQIREFWKYGAFDEEHYLVQAIRRHLLTMPQWKCLKDAGVSIEDLLNGRYRAHQRAVVVDVCSAWNRTLGFKAFYSGVDPSETQETDSL